MRARGHFVSGTNSSQITSAQLMITIEALQAMSTILMNIELLLDKFCDYATYIKGYSPYTIKRYRQTVRFFVHHTGIESVQQMTEQRLRQFFLDGRAKRHWSVANYRSHHKSLKMFLEWCVKEKYLETNPMYEVEVPRLESTLPQKLTKEETQKILEYVLNMPYPYRFLRYRNHAIFSTFIFAGLRKKELMNLHVTDVDVEHLSLFIRQGKGHKDRIIPISYTLAQSLRKYLAERKRLKRTCPYFFTSLNRDHGITDSCLKRLVKLVIQVSGIKFTLHKLRHTFATLMLQGGCDIYALSKMMGHEDIKTTSIYLNATVEHLQSMVNKHPLN
jgi:site-specific recombinase XerD